MDDALEFRPPYSGSFTTFWSFLRELLDKPLPPRIDRSLMRSKSGSDQASLTSTMKAFGLIDGNQTVTGLRDLVGTDEEARVAWLAESIREHYAVQVKVSDDNGTELDLRNSFREAFPSMESQETIRKAMTFFLHAASTARIPLSTHFPATRSGSGAPGTPKSRRTTSKRKSTPNPAKARTEDSPGNVPQSSTETRHVSLGSAGSVSITVDVRWLDLSDDQFAKLRSLIQQIESLGDSGTPATDQKAEVTP